MDFDDGSEMGLGGIGGVGDEGGAGVRAVVEMKPRGIDARSGADGEDRFDVGGGEA